MVYWILYHTFFFCSLMLRAFVPFFVEEPSSSYKLLSSFGSSYVFYVLKETYCRRHLPSLLWVQCAMQSEFYMFELSVVKLHQQHWQGAMQRAGRWALGISLSTRNSPCTLPRGCAVVEVMKHALKQSLLEIIVNDNLGRAVIILIGELFGLIVAHRKLTQQRS